VIVNSGFRSKVEDRWFAAARSAQGKDLNAFRKVDADLVDQEAKLLGAALKSVFESLRDGGSALIVGHSPTTEATVFGLTGVVVEPVAKGAGIRVVEEEGRYKLEALPADR
jgi:phosphohistidine phosphatase SixA